MFCLIDNMICRLIFLVCFVFVIAVECHPTVYKFNENKILEADLVPVSSTVIPIPIYQVSYGIDVHPSKAEKVKKPEGPVSLLTVHSKKKQLPTPKTKPNDVSTIKEIKQKTV